MVNMSKQHICLVCWMTQHPGQSTRLGADKHPHTCYRCGNLTQAGLTETVVDGTTKDLFQWAFLLLVVPALLIYLCQVPR